MKSYVNPLVREKLKGLYPGKEEKRLVEEYYKRKIKLSLLTAGAGLLLGTVSFIGGRGNKIFSEHGEILREAYDGNKLEIPAVAHSKQFGDVDIDIVVDQRTYNGEEREEAFDKTQKWLKQVMPGTNESLSCVREDLVLPDYYEECGIDICYGSSHYDLINENGRVRNENLKEETIVIIKAELIYGDYSRSCTFEAKVYPPILTEEEKFQRDLTQVLSDENQRQRQEETFRLPDRIGNEKVSFSEKGDKTFLYIVFMGFLAAALLYRGMDSDLDKLWAKRKKELLFSYPEFIGKLALLTGAGMNATGAIKRIYHNGKNGKMNPLYQELGYEKAGGGGGNKAAAAHDINAGGGFGNHYGSRVFYISDFLRKEAAVMKGLQRFIRDERGIGTVEMILILVVLIALVLIFKDQMTNLVNSIFEKITKQSGKV